MTVRSRLLAAWALTAALLLVPALYSVNRLSEVRDIAAEQRGRYAAAVVALGRLQTAVADLERYQRSYIATPDSALRRRIDMSLDRARAQITAIVEAGYPQVARTAATRLEEVRVVAEQILALVQAGRLVEATSRVPQIGVMLDELRTTLDDIAVEIDRRSRENLLEAYQISANAATGAMIAMAIAGILAIAIGLWTTGALTRPLRRLRAATANVAAGEFVAPTDLPYDRHDEVGGLARSFRTMTGRLAELERMRNEFVGMASHDLKTPIGVITGYSELLATGVYGEVNEKQRESLESIGEQADALTGMVNRLVDTSRAEAGELKVESEETDIRALIDHLRRGYNAVAERNDVELAFEVDDSVPRCIMADADRLRDQVFGNLFSNAFKFTPDGGRIALRATRRDNWVVIEVSDSGPGIPPDELPHVFDKYYQTRGTSRRKGAGLGLAIARQIVEAHDGIISAESVLGRGSTFRIKLPISREPTGTAEAA